MTNVAFVGVGHIHTPNFIKLVKARSDVRVKRVWDWDEERAKKRAGEMGAEVVKDVGEIWGDKDISSVMICSETNRHQELVMGAAD